MPQRFFDEPSTFGGSTGHVRELDDMLTERYAARGWRDGVVPADKLEALQVP
ncbi:MAG: aldehyde ferredoxin oxidoreductase C-terminal domain-containing protein [Planctomycetota bacterium]